MIPFDLAEPTAVLDEFYRTAIWLAGRTPLWWLVPATPPKATPKLPAR